MDDPQTMDEGRIAATWQNKAAGSALRVARQSVGPQGSKQTAFAASLAGELGITVTGTTLSGWETGRRTVPAAVLVAGAIAAHLSLDALLADAGPPQMQPWSADVGLHERLARLEQRLGATTGSDDEGIDHLRREVSDLGRLQARIIEALDRAAMWGAPGSDAEAHSSHSG